MTDVIKRKKQARVLRITRKVHRVTGIFLFVFFFLIAGTGLLLGWKKNSGGYLLPDTKTGSTTDLSKWLPMDSLHSLAIHHYLEHVPGSQPAEVDRIDARPGKGIVKFLFKNNYWGLQLDGATGALLQFEKRRSDFIENLHDASWFDNQFNTSGIIKLIYTTLMGMALILFTVTGFWLWYGPKRMRDYK